LIPTAAIEIGTLGEEPAGSPDFERVFRAHVNMLEWMPTFLVTL
jgi:glutathione S-transferase